MNVLAQFAAEIAANPPANSQEEFARAAVAAESKVNQVMQWIAANNDQCGDTRRIIKLFGLDWSLKRDLGNGIGVVQFWTDNTQRFPVMDLHLPITEWFRP